MTAISMSGITDKNRFLPGAMPSPGMAQNQEPVEKFRHGLTR